VPANDYRFVTEWAFEAPIERVFDLVRRPLRYPRWWPEAFLAVAEITAGNGDGIGQVWEARSRAWLPFSQRWRGTTLEVVAPIRMSFESAGCLGGLGIWTLWQHGPVTLVRFNWKFRAETAPLRWFWWICRPVLVANHRRAMARGEAGLRKVLGSAGGG
jgi:hypothetical protein